MECVGIAAKRNIELTYYPKTLEPPTADIAKLGRSRYFVCSAYSPPNNMCKPTEITDTLLKLSRLSVDMKVSGLIMLGDLNARHQAWGDHSHNRAGETQITDSRNTD